MQMPLLCAQYVCEVCAGHGLEFAEHDMKTVLRRGIHKSNRASISAVLAHIYPDSLASVSAVFAHSYADAGGTYSQHLVINGTKLDKPSTSSQVLGTLT